MGRQFLVSLSGLDPCVIRHVVLPFHRADCAMAGLIVDRESCSFASILWILSSRVERFPGQSRNPWEALTSQGGETIHPIELLTARAKESHRAMLEKQSTSLNEAVAGYRARYNRSPPKGFDEW